MLKRISELFKTQEQKPDVSKQLDAMLDDTRPVSDQLDDMLAKSETMPIETLVDQEEYIFEPDESITEPGPDLGYIQHSSEIVGYPNREIQWNSYRLVANVIEDGASILDFGAGRGDFKVFMSSEYEIPYDTIEYIGIDFNKILVDAGKEVYGEEIDLRHMSWFDLPSDVKGDWCINVNSLNLRYDAATSSDWDYFIQSVTKMYDHANRGVVVILSSNLSPNPENSDLINFEPGQVLNWAQRSFGGVALDHSYSEDVYTLIIYK